jgi:FkbM family methyltransferase
MQRHGAESTSATKEDQGDWRDRIKDIVRRHHRFALFSTLAQLSKTYLRAYYNENHYRFAYNGERFVLETLRNVKGSDAAVAFDVGAHVGLWARAFIDCFPNGEVHCFEIAPQTFKLLKQELDADPRFHINDRGLSSEEGTVALNYSPNSTTTATVHEAMLASAWGFDVQKVEARITTGDKYVAEEDVQRLDILKIDTEGHDLSVLKGFHQTLAQRPIPMIQFEHGFVHIPARSLLRDFYEYLQPLGYTIGRLHPRCVEFKDYDLCEDEQFRMGNYIAVHGTEKALIDALAGNGR